MEYNQQLTEALHNISISPTLVVDPNSMRILLEDKLDEAHSNIFHINITGLRSDVNITRGELEIYNDINNAYTLFMDNYEEYLDNSIINNY